MVTLRYRLWLTVTFDGTMGVFRRLGGRDCGQLAVIVTFSVWVSQIWDAPTTWRGAALREIWKFITERPKTRRKLSTFQISRVDDP